MKKTDEVYLQDILEMIQKIEFFVKDVDFESFEKDEEKQFAIFHALEVIGEAANKLSADFVASNPIFPTKEAIELRNILIHGYDIIRLDIVWKTLQDNLPLLKKQLQSLLSLK